MAQPQHTPSLKRWFLFGDLRGATSIRELRAIIRARIIQSAGAWRLRASLRTFRSSTASSGARARRSFGTYSSPSLINGPATRLHILPLRNVALNHFALRSR